MHVADIEQSDLALVDGGVREWFTRRGAITANGDAVAAWATAIARAVDSEVHV